MVSELVKLVGIVGGGAIIGGIGQVISLKKRKEREEKRLKQQNTDHSDYNSSTTSEEEKKAKDYIEQYKTSYTKEAITLGLHNLGISDDEAKKYVEKYF